MTTPSLGYTSRRGVVWYLHQTATKKGQRRLFAARTVREGALAVMPDGYGFTESLTGVVSVSRVDPQAASAKADDVALVRAELDRHLRGWLVATDAWNIVVLRPLGKTSTDPVLKFGSNPNDRTTYQAARARHSGNGGRLPILGGHGPLPALVAKFLPLLGTERFDELW